MARENNGAWPGGGVADPDAFLQFANEQVAYADQLRSVHRLQGIGARGLGGTRADNFFEPGFATDRGVPTHVARQSVGQLGIRFS